MVLEFHQHIVAELLEEPNGGLVILSSGLSLPRLIATLLLLHTPSEGTLLLLSSSPSLKSHLLHHLPHPPSEITADLPSSQRHSLYSSGLVFFITSRILIVDLLNNKIPTSNLAGIVILNTHSLSDSFYRDFYLQDCQVTQQECVHPGLL
ncbi:hypothetical protein Dsin_004887 [Dipteronia sinensis]|uniref:Uncharacterized protein n=1 Tax=Dipteronia sinensis TaxID=43782 RepID=A0AAE0EFZ0_9ROSI|nr:hypothetical protein Dsin_004887 [Dipteronia sinensis]